MKTCVVLIACMLAIAATHEYNEELSEKFNETYRQCVREQGVPFEPRFELLRCTLHGFGSIINEHGAFNRAYSMEILSKIIDGEEKVQQAQKNIAKCIDDANEGPSATNEEKSDLAIRCGVQYAPLYVNFPKA